MDKEERQTNLGGLKVMVSGIHRILSTLRGDEELAGGCLSKGAGWTAREVV